MKLHQLVLEKVSPIVYHAAPFEGAIGMLRSNVLRSPAGTISMTRSLSGSYHTKNKMIGAIFELDGNLINRKYPGKPVGTEDYPSGDDDDVIYRGKRNKQLEDRVMTDKITDLFSYIRQVHIFIPLEYMEDSHEDEFEYNYKDNLGHVEEIVDHLKSNNIPYRVVFKEKDLFNKRVNDADKLHAFLHKDDEPDHVIYDITLGKFSDGLKDEDWEAGIHNLTPDESKVIQVKAPPYMEDEVEDRVWGKLGQKSPWVVLYVDAQY